MSVLVTGGAGYIGAHVVDLLQRRGDEVVVVDDLITGDAARLVGVVPHVLGLAETDATQRLEAIIREHSVDSIIHFAARKRVDESVSRPSWYFQQNLGSLANVLLAAEATGVEQVLFSSSAAVYGSSEGLLLDEATATSPINPYGETKLVGEWMVADAARASGLRAASLRYFNVAGAGEPRLGDTAVLNLVPMVFERIDAGAAPLIFGADYPTPDGTCIRDYVHVLDLAEAHLATLDSLAKGDARHDVFNVGTGVGSSVREMIDAILAYVGSDLVAEVRPRRAGDPAAVVADPRLIASTVGWRATRGLPEIVASAWDSHVTHAASRS